MRVLSSPATVAPKDWGVNAISRDSMSSTGSTSGSGSFGAGADEGRLMAGVEGQMDEIARGDADSGASGSEMLTPAINTPLLPAFLRDVVSSPSGSKSDDDEKELLGTSSGSIAIQCPKALEGVEISPHESLAGITKSPLSGPPSYEAGFTPAFPPRMGTTNFPVTMMAVTNPAPQKFPRTRNDSGSSNSSSSSLLSLSSSNLSTSGVSLSLSATSLSSNGCGGGSQPNVRRMGGSIRITPPAGSLGPRSSSSSPTLTTTSLCPTPPADKGSPASVVPGSTPATASSSLPFVSFGDSGIWKMDGKESMSLKGFYAPHPSPRHDHRGFAGGQRVSKHGHHHHHNHGGHELQAPLLLPVGAERRMC